MHLHAPPLANLKQKSKETTASALPLNQETGIQMLIEYLDTVYSDADGWLQLAQVYTSMKL